MLQLRLAVVPTALCVSSFKKTYWVEEATWRGDSCHVSLVHVLHHTKAKIPLLSGLCSHDYILCHFGQRFPRFAIQALRHRSYITHPSATIVGVNCSYRKRLQLLAICPQRVLCHADCR